MKSIGCQKIPSVLGLDASFCPASPTHRVALLILSAPANFKKRLKLRKLRMEGFSLHFLFLIGSSKNRTVEKMLEKVVLPLLLLLLLRFMSPSSRSVISTATSSASL